MSFRWYVGFWERHLKCMLECVYVTKVVFWGICTSCSLHIRIFVHHVVDMLKDVYAILTVYLNMCTSCR